MCRKVTCQQCKKASWAGCGAHVEQVLRDVPAAQRCQCGERAAGQAKEPAPDSGRSWLGRLLGR